MVSDRVFLRTFISAMLFNFTLSAAFGAVPDYPSCLAGLLGCNTDIPSIETLERYRPASFAPLPALPVVDPEWMFNVDAQPKTFVRAYAWNHTGQAVARYGRPYQVGGVWVVDFYVQALMVPGERRLWRMPAKDFFEGVGQKSSDWSE